MALPTTGWPRASSPWLPGEPPKSGGGSSLCATARGGVTPDLSWRDREQKRTPGVTGADPAPLSFPPRCRRAPSRGRVVQTGAPWSEPGPPSQASPPFLAPPGVPLHWLLLLGCGICRGGWWWWWGAGGGRGGRRGGWRRDGAAPNSALPCLCNLNRPTPSPVRVPRGSAALRCSQAGGGFGSALAVSLCPARQPQPGSLPDTGRRHRAPAGNRPGRS